MDLRSLIIYFAIGCIWAFHKLKTPKERIEEQLTEEYSIEHSKMLANTIANSKKLVFITYVIFWPINIFFTLRYKLFKK